jgi:hypothetical protein
VDFNGWFSRVFEVSRRSFGRLTVLASIPAAVSLVYQLVLVANLPDENEFRRMVEQQGTQANPFALVETLLDQMLPVVIVFTVLSAIAGALMQAASVFVVIRDSANQRTTTAEALRFAAPRVPAVVLWSLVAGLATMIGFALVTPGVSLGSGPLAQLGILIATVLAAYLAVTFISSLLGVVVVERRALARCFTLIRDRWWATFGRLAVIGLVGVCYLFAVTVVGAALGVAVASGSPLTGAPNLSFGTIVVTVIQVALMIPVLIVFAGVVTVTYAELRFRENSAVTTASLSSELNPQ